MPGSIEMTNGKEEQPQRSTLFSQTLKRWLAMLAETFQRNSSLSVLQVKAYEVALADLSVAQLNQACEKTLRTWTFVAMPPPGFIRECVDRQASDAEEYLGLPQLTYPDVTPEEREAALNDPEYQEFRAKIHVVAEQKRLSSKPRAETDHLVIADNERLHELDRQREYIRRKYGKPA
jgi:hypothetical protein